MKKLLLAALAVAGLATACRKDDDVVTCPAPGPASLDALTKQFAPPVQVFTFNPAQAQTIRSVGGATLTLAANGLVRPDGTAPTGPVRLQFQEIYDPSAMLLANMPTQTIWGQLLESGGEFCVRAYEGATRLRLRNQAANLTSPVLPRISPARRDSMSLWTWMPRWSSNTDSSGWWPVTNTIMTSSYTINATTGDTTWFTSSTTIGVSVPATNSYYNNSVFPDTIGWLNYDVYLPTPTSATVYVTLAAGAPEQRVYLIPHDLNGAFRPYYDPAQQRFRQENLPAGTDLTAVVIQVRDGKYYFGTHRAPAADGFTYRPALEEVSEEELVRRIRLL